ncbi:MAG: hypothetical protein PW843_17710 [Azospirillaceae bacterium]|nr:hypothetical protein [Azospirillaceae bacterium]
MLLMDAFADAYANPSPLHVGALALGGAAMIYSLNRVITEIRKTERRVTAVVEERNKAAAALRAARQQEGQIKSALKEVEEELVEMTARTSEIETRKNTLQQVIPRRLNLVSQAWSSGDTLFEARVSPISGATDGGGGGTSLVHGYAGSAREFNNRVIARFPSTTHVVLDVTAIDLDALDMAVTNLDAANAS